jgi:hypothetical protein
MVQDEMAVVAIGADSGGEQALFLQPYPVDAGRVIDDHVSLLDVRDPSCLPLYAVTFAAKAGNIRPVDGGIELPLGDDMMASVAIGAVRGVRFSLQMGLPVRTLIVVFRGLGMATGAVNLAGGLAGTGEAGVDIRVAFDTGDVFVGGIL